MSTETDPRVTVAECDAILRKYAGAGDNLDAQKLIAHALTRKAWSLAQLGNQRDAAELCAEAADRFIDSDDPDIREQVVFALGCRIRLLIADPAEIDTVIEACEQLLSRLWDEPAESLGFLADTCIASARVLLTHPGAPPWAVLTFAGETSLNAVSHYAASAWARLRARTENPVVAGVAGAAGRILPGSVARQRRRAAESLKLCAAVTARLGEDDAPELAPLLTRAAVTASSAQLNLGRLGASVTAFTAVTVGQNPDAVQAFQRFADEESGRPGFVGTLNLLGYLRQRAESLVGDEPALARIAYDDSVDLRLPPRRSWLVSAAVRLFRP